MRTESTPLFGDLPVYDVPLPQDELKLLAELPAWPIQQEIPEEQHGPARRLEKKGMIKISRQLMDPAGHYPDWFGGVVSDSAQSTTLGRDS